MSGTIQRKVGIESMVNNNNDDNDIVALLAALDWGPGALTNEEMLDRSHAALTALVAERDGLLGRVAAQDADILALRKRVAELEALPPDDAMTKWMDQVTVMLCHSMTHSHDAKQELVTRCDAAIAAMRKGESDAY